MKPHWVYTWLHRHLSGIVTPHIPFASQIDVQSDWWQYFSCHFHHLWRGKVSWCELENGLACLWPKCCQNPCAKEGTYCSGFISQRHQILMRKKVWAVTKDKVPYGLTHRKWPLEPLALVFSGGASAPLAKYPVKGRMISLDWKGTF